MAVKKKRPKMTTKEELIEYLENNLDTELPFNENVWNIAVEKTKDKERKNKIIESTDFEGNVSRKVIPNGSINPVSKYFQMIALPQYKNPITKQDYDDISGDYQDELDEEEQEYIDDLEDKQKKLALDSWVSTFFSEYSKSDLKFLKERLSDYYDNYEINEGADKLLVVTVVTDELEIMNLTKMRIKGKDVEARLEKVKKGYMNSLEGLKALKKQRGAMEDEGKNKLTLWVDELTKAGEFKAIKTVYDEDAIDVMLRTFETSMMMVMREG